MKLPTLEEVIERFDPVPEVVMVPLLLKVVTVRLLAAMSKVPAVIVKVVAVKLPPAVKVTPLPFKVSVV